MVFNLKKNISPCQCQCSYSINLYFIPVLRIHLIFMRIRIQVQVISSFKVFKFFVLFFAYYYAKLKNHSEIRKFVLSLFFKSSNLGFESEIFRIRIKEAKILRIQRFRIRILSTALYLI